MTKPLVGVIGSGAIGYDPFDRKCWSGISYYFFGGLRSRSQLRRAFGVEASRLVRYGLMARNYNANRSCWRYKFYMDPAYRRALTRQVAGRIEESDLECDFIQLGAMFDVPSLVKGRARCYSYHDGNLAESLRSPNCPQGLDARKIDEALTYEREVYRKIDRIFTMSEYLRRSFIDDFGVPEGLVTCIGAGVNLDTIPDAPVGKRYDTKEILFIGIDFVRKGGQELLRAFREVRRSHPRAKLHIVGPKSLQIEPGLEAGVEFHGYLSKVNERDRANLDHLLRRASLFVMPSLYEPFGIAPLEAMAHEIPAVLTDRWAFREFVTPRAHGDLVPCGDAPRLAECLIRLLDDPSGLDRMGKAARQRVLADYTWDKVLDRLTACLSGPA